MAPDGRVRNGSAHGARNGFHRRKWDFMGSARQRMARGDLYGAGIVLQSAPPLDLVRMQEADRVAYGAEGGAWPPNPSKHISTVPSTGKMPPPGPGPRGRSTDCGNGLSAQCVRMRSEINRSPRFQGTAFRRLTLGRPHTEIYWPRTANNALDRCT